MLIFFLDILRSFMNINQVSENFDQTLVYLWISLNLEFWLQFCEKRVALIYIDVYDLSATPGDTYFSVLTNTVISNQQHLKNDHGLETICDLTANFSVLRSTMANWTV